MAKKKAKKKVAKKKVAKKKKQFCELVVALIRYGKVKQTTAGLWAVTQNFDFQLTR